MNTLGRIYVEPLVSLKTLLSGEGRRDPYAFYARLHALGPVSPLDAARDRNHAVVNGYEAVSAVLRSPGFGMVDAAYMDARQGQWREHSALRTLHGSIFMTNGPDHARVRRLFSQVFTPRRIAALEPAVGRLIEERLDHLEELGAGGRPVDFMAEFALPLPSDVIGELLGVPTEDRSWFPQRVARFGAIVELGDAKWKYLNAANRASDELTGYFAVLVDKRRVEPADDLLSGLVQVQAAEDGRISDEELLANLITLFNAGFVTTTHLFGNGLTLLLEEPARRAELLAEPDLVPAYIEEILRYEPPVHFGIRQCYADTDLYGVPLSAGDTVVVLLGAANRDPSRFPDPDVFDPRRPDNVPLSFGAGLHYCLGAALSRLEGRLALPMLLTRFPKLAVAGEPGERSRLGLRGYSHLHVTLS